MKQKIKILELFGGIGAPRKALENLGFIVENVDYIENWSWAVKAYNLLFNSNYESKDINFYAQWKKKWNKTAIDILIHGSPCQDWSKAGKNDLSTGRSLLFLRTLAIINELKMRPKYIVWENVTGLISKKHQPYFQHYLDIVAKYGYKNYWKVLNAKDFGIPQSRNRIFVVSIRKDLNQSFSWNNLITQPMKSLLNFININKSAATYFIKSESMKKAIKKGKVNNLAKINNEYWQINEYKEFNNFFTLPRASDGKVINGGYNRYWKVLRQPGAYIGTVAATNPLKLIFPPVKPISGVPIFIINDQPYHLRILTARETWLLMGFTNADFEKVKPIPKTHLYHLAGNSIVVPVLEAIFTELLTKKN